MRFALLTAALLATTPAVAATEQETNAAAIALCRAAIAAKAPAATTTFERGDFKARSARIEFTVRDGNARQTARCRVSNKDKTVTDLSIG